MTCRRYGFQESRNDGRGVVIQVEPPPPPPPSATSQATPSRQVWAASHLQTRLQPRSQAPAPALALVLVLVLPPAPVPPLAPIPDPFGFPTQVQPLQRSRLPALAQFPRGFRIVLPRSPQDPGPRRILELWAARGTWSLSQQLRESSGLGMEGHSFVPGSLRRKWECLRLSLSSVVSSAHVRVFGEDHRSMPPTPRPLL